MTEENDNLGGIFRSKDSQIIEQSKDYIKIYANNVNISVSLWDMSLVFGEIIDEKDDKPVVEQKVKVNMSKEFTKVLTILLNKNIEAYEKQFGEIKIIQPPQPPTKEEQVLASAARRKKK